MKKIRIVLSPEAEEIYNYLNKQSQTSKIEKAILRAFNKKKELIKANCHYGDPIPKKLIPKEYKRKYGVTNLFRIDPTNF